MYHSPCFDGIYALMNLFLVLKTKITYDNWTVQDIMKKIEEQITDVKEKSLEKENVKINE